MVFTQGEDIQAAITFEKKIKNRSRQWKIDLIEKTNPRWDDLATGWLDSGSCDCAQDDAFCTVQNAEPKKGRRVNDYKTIARSNNFIVLDKYTQEWKVSESYQSEYDLEREFIADLQNQGYEYVPGLNTPEALLANVRLQLANAQ